MKELIILCSIFTILFLLISCEEYNEQKEKREMESFIESELATSIRSDTIFLDFRFGMTKKEFNSHLNKLERKGKLKVNKKNNYVYIFDVDEGYTKWKAHATLGSEFFDGKLIQLFLLVTSEELLSNEILKMQLSMLYMNSFKGRIFSEKPVLGDSDNYIFIDKNKKIKIIEGINEVRIFYTDMIAEKLKKDEDQQNSIESMKKIQEDL